MPPMLTLCGLLKLRHFFARNIAFHQFLCLSAVAFSKPRHFTAAMRGKATTMTRPSQPINQTKRCAFVYWNWFCHQTLSIDRLLPSVKLLSVKAGALIDWLHHLIDFTRLPNTPIPAVDYPIEKLHRQHKHKHIVVMRAGPKTMNDGKIGLSQPTCQLHMQIGRFTSACSDKSNSLSNTRTRAAF